MNDFYKTIYNHAWETKSLYFEADPEFRTASRSLDELMEQLHPDEKTYDALMDAFHLLLYTANVLSFSYGFRLAVQVTTPVASIYSKPV